MQSDIRSRFIAAIQKTGDPMAPIKLQDAYGVTKRLCVLMILAGADKDKTVSLVDNLLSAFPDDMDHIAADPSFVCALCSLLENAIVAYGASLIEEA